MRTTAIFDVDGTLVDSNAFHAEAWRRVFGRHGVDIAVEAIRLQIGKGGDNLVPALLPPELAERAGDAIREERKQLFQDAYSDRVEPFPGVRETFEGLAGHGARIVLASSAPRAEIDRNIERLGIADLLHASTSAEEVEHSKPHPDVFAAALDKAGCDKDEAVIVGDSPWDLEAARRLGVAAVAVRCGGFDGALLLAAGARALHDGPWALPHRLEDWF